MFEENLTSFSRLSKEEILLDKRDKAMSCRILSKNSHDPEEKATTKRLLARDATR